MKRTGFSRASWLVRFFFLLILLLRLGRACFVTLPAVYACSLNCTDPNFLWVSLKMAADLVFLGLVWARFDRIWVAPVTFFWLSVQTIVSVEGNAVTMEGLKTILFLFPFVLLGGFAVGKWFTWSGIRGRILIVCLASAALPMFYLGLALVQQTVLLIDHAFFPKARGMIETELKQLNTAVKQRMNEDLAILMGVPPHASGVMNIPLVPESEYWSRAASLGIPLAIVQEVNPILGASRVSLDFDGITLQDLLDILGKRFSFPFGIRSDAAAQKTISLHGTDLPLDQILRQIQDLPDVSLEWEAGNLILDSKSAPGSSSLRVALAAGGNSRNSQFTEFEQSFLDSHGDPANYEFYYGTDFHRCLIRIPEWTGGRVTRGMILMIKFRNWLDKLLHRSLQSGEYRIKICYPLTPENIQIVFSGFEMIKESGSREPLEWKKIELPQESFRSTSGRISAIQGPLFPLGESPRQQDYPIFRNLEVHSPQMTDYVLECWELPFCGASLLVSIATDHVWPALFHNQGKSLVYCFLAVLLAAFMGFVYSDRLSRPIQDITRAAREIRDGKLSGRIPEQFGEAEIEELATSLDLMAQKLTGRIALANQQLVAEKERFETLLESTWEGIFLLDGKGVVVYGNHAGRQLLASLNSGDEFFRAVQEVGTEFQPPVSDSWKNGTGEFKCVFQLPCGSQGNRKILALYIRACHHSVSKEGGAVEPGYIAVLRDITVEKEIDRMKSDFVSQVSHELRTPLTSIKAYTEMLLDDEVDDPENRRDYLRITFDEAERLTRLINDLLDIARIESGRRPLKLSEIDLHAMTREIAEVMKGQIEKAQQTLRLELPAGPMFLLGDADLLKQAGLNLLSNASKYTKPGGTINLSAEIRSDGMLVWKFSDTGVGLSPRDKDKLFEKFFRSDSEFVRAAGGTGLGLTLVKNIIDLHQGEITVESAVDKGTLFTVILPSRRSRGEGAA